MPKITIDNQTIEFQSGETIMDIARRVEISIPSMCFLEGYPAQTSCMVCVVKINGSAKLVPSCATRATNDMVVESESEEVREARRVALELLLSDHLGDCVGPCQSGCPAHMDIPAMIGHIVSGRYREAIAVVKERIPLPATLGRICPELCEKGCRRGAADAPVSICKLKRFVADFDLASDEPYQPECKPDTGRRVAIVGSGPAGLSAAYYLLREGHKCVIFDDRPLPGGTLRYKVPDDKLPRNVLDAEIGLIEKMGAEFRMSTPIGLEHTLDSLRGEFDAVLLTVGQVDKNDAGILGLQPSTHGLKVDAHTQMTGVPGVFAAGSAVTPSHYAVRAVAGGRTAAFAISAYLAGKPITDHHNPWTVHIGKLMPGEVSDFMKGASETGRTQPVGEGFTEEEARSEASRCLHCECGKLSGCKLREIAVEYGAQPARFKGERKRFERESTHPKLIYEPGKCISCGLCVEIAAAAGEELGLTFIGRGFNVRIDVPFDETIAQGLSKAARECAEACPTGAIVLRAET